MLKYPVYNSEGEKTKDIDLPRSLFGVTRNDSLIHQVYVAQSANRRSVIAHAKDRAERSGSGKKPWRQKGTGRARVGSVRSPIWRKGGIIFGPAKERNFKKDIPKKMKRRAFAMALSGKVEDKEMVVVENLKFKEPKTRLAKQAIDKLEVKGSMLLALAKNEREAGRAVRNLPNVYYIDAKNLSVFDILNNKNLVLSEEGVEVIKSRFNTVKINKQADSTK